MCKTNENKELCAKCGGRCCNALPGIYIPADLFKEGEEITEEKIMNLLKEGNTSIDRWEGEESGTDTQYYLRPKRIKVKNISDYYDPFEVLCRGLMVFAESIMGARHDEEYMVDLDFDQSGSRCIHLTESGCVLDYDKRPYECRKLIPNYPDECHYGDLREDFKELPDDTPKYYFAYQWNEYNELLENIADKILYGTDFEDKEEEK